jgi:hypothetical protein
LIRQSKNVLEYSEYSEYSDDPSTRVLRGTPEYSEYGVNNWIILGANLLVNGICHFVNGICHFVNGICHFVNGICHHFHVVPVVLSSPIYKNKTPSVSNSNETHQKANYAFDG